MNLKYKDILLKIINENDLELMRSWRNESSINQYMIDRRYISNEDQLEWYQNLDKSINKYFLVYYKNQSLGVANLKNISLINKSAEAGLYVAVSKFQNGIIPIIILFLLYDYAFFELNLNELYGKVLNTNKRAEKINMYFGFEKVSSNQEFSNYRLSIDNFKKLSILPSFKSRPNS